VGRPREQENLSFMRCFVIAVLVLQAATVIDVETDSRVTLPVEIGDVIYTGEFSRQALSPDIVHEGEQIQAEVKRGKVTVQCKNGKRATARIIRVQRILVHPHP
jgi:hypothetical protein